MLGFRLFETYLCISMWILVFNFPFILKCLLVFQDPYLGCESITDPVFCCSQVNTWTGSCAGTPSFPCLCYVRCPAPKTVCSVPGLHGLCAPIPAQGRTRRASRPDHAPFWPTTLGTVGFLVLSNHSFFSPKWCGLSWCLGRGSSNTSQNWISI